MTMVELAAPLGTAPLPADIQPRPTTNEEIGVTLNLPFGSYDGELLNPAETDIPNLLQRIDIMLRTDGHFRALARLLSLPFRQAKWSIVPDEDGEDEADFITQMLTRPPYQGGMTTSFDYVRALAAKAFWQGYAVWEEVYAIAEVPGYGQCITLRKLAPREAHTIRFKADDHGGFDGVRQRASDRSGGMRTIDIPGHKTLFFTVDKEEHPFYGRSMFEPALYHFDKKHKLYYIAHIAAQIAAVPGRIAYQEMGGDELTPSKKTALQTALANFGFNTAMIAPKGIKIEPFQAGTDSAISGIMELIAHHNIQASQSILAQFIDLGQSGSSSVGSFALSKDSSDIFLMCSQALLNSFAETLSVHLFPKFIDWNFGTKKYPTLVFDPLADETKAAMMEVFSSLATAATTQVSPDFIWELEQRVADQLGLAIDYEALDAEREAMMEQEALVADAIGALSGEGIGVPPGAPVDPGAPPELVAAADGTPHAIFLTSDYELLQLAEGQSKTEIAREEARRRRQSEKGKRDKLGQFSRINEVGRGAGLGGQSDLGPVTADIQGRLAALGFDLGAPGVDGKFGPITAAAVKAFQSDNGLPATGRVDMGTYALLLEQAPKAQKSTKKAKGASFGGRRKKAGGGLQEAAKNARDLRDKKGAKGVSDED